MNDAELDQWARAHAPAGSSVAVAVLRVLADYAAMTATAASMTRLCLAFADRIADQSEALSKRAERPHNDPCPYCEGRAEYGRVCAMCQGTGVRHPVM